MKDLKYIIKRILIGVGIVICLSCINRCKVNALVVDYNQSTYTNNFNLSDISDDYVLIVNYDFINVYKNINNNDIAFCYIDKCVNYKISELNFNYTNVGFILNVANQNLPNHIQNRVSSLILCENNLPKINRIRNNSPYFNYTDSCLYLTPYANYNNTPFTVGEFGTKFYKISNENDTYHNGFIYNFNDLNSNNYKNNGFFSNINWNYYEDYYVSDDNIINIAGIPDFVSFNSVPITNNNVITSYVLRPEFSLFDNDNYKYQYSFDANRWLYFNENEQLLRININTTIYVRILNRENDEYINGATLTISNIGTFYNDEDFKINFSGEYRTENYLSNNISSKSQSIIKEYQIYVDYIPKSSILTYQYQYVENGDFLNDNNWQNVSSLDNGSLTYVASSNGTLYARIIDRNNEIKATGTFTVNNIGLLAFDSNEKGVNNFFTKISSKINFSGPISDIINIPLQLINTISVGLSGGLSCNNYSLGSLWGTNLVIPCVNVRQHLGNSLYTTIDLIISCVMIYYIFKMFSDLYNNMLFIQKNPIQDLGKRGD